MHQLDDACVVCRRGVKGGFGASIDFIKRTHRAAAAAAAATQTGCPEAKAAASSSSAVQSQVFGFFFNIGILSI